MRNKGAREAFVPYFRDILKYNALLRRLIKKTEAASVKNEFSYKLRRNQREMHQIRELIMSL